MKHFKVLDRDLALHQNYLLEASAGTGKTFSIQNIVVRLLIEANGLLDPLSLQKILVVTFTRAATRDLKMRIRSNIEEAFNILTSSKADLSASLSVVPDYLKAFLEKGEDAIQEARKRLQQALFIFDQAQIFTIHSFCSRMLRKYALESDMGLYSLSGDEPLPQSEVMTIIRDFFRTEVRADQYSAVQIGILLKGDPDQKLLLKAIRSGYSFPFFSAFKELYRQFTEKMRFLKDSLLLVSEKIVDDFQTQAGDYRNYKSGETKAETLEKIIRFAKLFDQDEWSEGDLDSLIKDGLVWVKALDPSLLKRNSSSGAYLHYPTFFKELKLTLERLIEEGGDFAILLARMARDCQRLLRRYQKEEEKLSPHDILLKINRALDQPAFLQQVQCHYQAVIIDEFQDTDPLQWEIFQRLFIPDGHSWKGYLYLVGDPKQSIYSFRQADIYTYLAAAQKLGEAHCFSLDVNYRSQPRLIEALNMLFDSEHLPQFMPLPKKLMSLSYQPVRASNLIRSPFSEDEQGAIHFCIADGQAFKKPKLIDLERQVFFPFIAQEVVGLKKRHQLDFRQFAVLVRDRHQALRLAEYFDSLKIPYLNQRGTSLADSEALQALIEFIYAVLHPQDRGALRTAFGNALMGWTHEEMKKLESIESILALMQNLRTCLFVKGFAAFFTEMLHTTFQNENSTILEKILAREGGIEFYHDLQQIADTIVDHQFQEWNGPEGIIPFLDRFQVWDENEDERVKRFQDPTVDGVKILTLHFSKGLEFDIVFALGLVNRVSMSEELIPILSEDGKPILAPLSNDCEEYRHYCEESDAEKMRQLYVALTRAKYQLYIPVALHLPSDRLKWGEASPMDLFLARFGQKAASYSELYETIKTYAGKSLLEFLDAKGKSCSITYSVHQQICLNISVENERKAQTLIEPSKIAVIHQPLWMTSFSTLSQHLEYKASERLELLTRFPHDYESLIKDEHTLPANNETGLLVHHLLERLSFKDFKHLESPDQVIPLVRPFLQNTKFREWEEAIASIVFNTLKTHLPSIEGCFCLADLEDIHCYREMPFVFPYKKGGGIEEIEFKEGLIKGIIDLLFWHDGKYYLLDWKTNWLGLNSEAYLPSLLQLSMKENAYFLQAAIYTEAIKRYLKLVDSRSFEECFGGTFYLFLRGLQVGRQTGIYHFLPYSKNLSYRFLEAIS